MVSPHVCGPQYASEFFQGIHAASVHARTKYLISCIDHEVDVLGINFERSVGVTTASDGLLTTAFIDRGSLSERQRLKAYKWLGKTPIAYADLLGFGSEIEFGGPEVDTDFFQALADLCAKYPNEGRTYSIVSREIFSKGLSLSGDDNVVEGAIRNGKVYHKIKHGDAIPANCVCCTWDDNTGNCNGTWCDE